MSSISVCSLPRYCLVTLRPKITVILFGCPIVRLASSRRWPRLSSAARRWKMRLSQYSTCEKNSRCWHPACSRSLVVKKGVRCVSHFWPQVTRSRGVSELASSCRRSGTAHFKKALAVCLNPMPFSRMRLASQWCWLRQVRAENGREGPDGPENHSPVPVFVLKLDLNYHRCPDLSGHS